MAPFHPIDVSVVHLAYALLGGFVVVFGMFSLFLKERLYIGEAVWATVFGIIIGPYCAGVFDPRGWGASTHEGTNAITLEVTRVVLAVGVFAIGVELPKAYVGRHWRSLTFLLVPVMTYGWFVSAGLIYALIPGLNFLSSLVVAACLTPTDPILAAAVVGGRYAEKHVPAHLRHLLAAESGVNDGAAFPMLFIAIYLILEQSNGVAVGEWFYITWVYEILLGIVLGSIIGYGFRHLMKFCERNDLIDRHSYVAQYVSLALLSIGITTILGSDDLLAAFASGTAFAYDGWFNKKTEESLFSNVIDLLFNCACFIYIGAWIPFNDFDAPELTLSVWRLVVIAILVLLLRRIPIMMALYRWIPEVKTAREAVFSGHFGPMGVGAVFISTLALEKLPAPRNPPETQLDVLASSMQPIIAFIVLCSIVVHGLSIPFFSLGRRVHSMSRTWSRHQSMDTGPEWANQARRVQRAEDIVINRDREDIIADQALLEKMEKGEISVHDFAREKEEREQSRAESSGTTVAATPGEEDIGDIPIPRSESPRSELDVEEERRKRRSKDGSPVPDDEQKAGNTTEWQEGHDLIIERSRGVGEEEEVEVIHNHFNDDETNTISKGLKSELRKHDPRLQTESKDKGKTNIHLEAGGERATTGGSAKHPHAAAEHDRTQHEHEDESPFDGADNDDDDLIEEDEAGPSHPDRSRSKSPKSIPSGSNPPKKRPIFIKSSRPSQRRESFRRHIFGGQAKKISHTPDDDDEPRPPTSSSSSSDEPPESRATPAPIDSPDRTGGSPTPRRARFDIEGGGEQPRGESPNPAILRQRLDLAREQQRRSASPGRSIRFADSGRVPSSGSLSRLAYQHHQAHGSSGSGSRFHRTATLTPPNEPTATSDEQPRVTFGSRPNLPER